MSTNLSGTGPFEDLCQEVAYAYDRVTFFRAHLNEAGLTPADIRRPDDIKRIPTTRKRHYRRNYPSGVLASGFSLNDPHVMRFQSSGTSGERLNSAILSYDLARRQATAMSVNHNFNALWRPGERPRICRYAPPNCSDVECGVGFTTMAERTLEDGTLVLSVAHDLLATPDRMIDQALDEIAAYDPEMLVVDPTHLAFLIRRATQRGRRIETSRKLHIVCGYTQLTRIARRQIQEFFGDEVPIGNMLGMSELGYLGFECHHGRLHMNNEDFYLEFLDDQGNDVAIGDIGELVISTIDDALLPRIRYATGDLYRRLEGRCECGSGLPLVGMEGRATHNLTLSDGRQVTPAEVDLCVGDCPEIDLYKLEQNTGGNLRFRYLANDRMTTAAERALHDRLCDLLHSRDIIFENLDYIACERSGKFQSCASQFDPASIAASTLQGA